MGVTRGSTTAQAQYAHLDVHELLAAALVACLAAVLDVVLNRLQGRGEAGHVAIEVTLDVRHLVLDLVLLSERCLLLRAHHGWQQHVGEKLFSRRVRPLIEVVCLLEDLIGQGEQQGLRKESTGGGLYMFSTAGISLYVPESGR